MFTKSKNILFTTMSVLTLSLGTANANCYQEVMDSDFELSVGDGGFLKAGALTSSGLAISSIVDGSSAMFAIAPVSLAAVSTSVVAYDLMKDLSESEEYAAKVIYGATYGVEPGQSPILASFIKNVKREIGQDPNAVIPSDYEVIQEVKQVNHDVSACTDDDGDFFRPTKESLKSLVVENLTY